ncbi:hypothetical protein GCM10011363_11740 [Marivita lacus]|uniref:Uncharacterized protein n=1 Tax=Marivita lacus TaxID=1323742 RepID=A0ABQ1KE70_9RHOB|nr:hypothetical protein GCM10011363_11740 [Marivita lacus]
MRRVQIRRFRQGTGARCQCNAGDGRCIFTFEAGLNVQGCAEREGWGVDRDLPAISAASREAGDPFGAVPVGYFGRSGVDCDKSRVHSLGSEVRGGDKIAGEDAKRYHGEINITFFA